MRARAHTHTHTQTHTHTDAGARQQQMDKTAIRGHDLSVPEVGQTRAHLPASPTTTLATAPIPPAPTHARTHARTDARTYARTHGTHTRGVHAQPRTQS